LRRGEKKKAKNGYGNYHTEVNGMSGKNIGKTLGFHEPRMGPNDETENSGGKAKAKEVLTNKTEDDGYRY